MSLKADVDTWQFPDRTWLANLTVASDDRRHVVGQGHGHSEADAIADALDFARNAMRLVEIAVAERRPFRGDS